MGEPKFDFSKPEDQKKFDKLSSDTKREIIDEAHNEAKHEDAARNFEKLNKQQIFNRSVEDIGEILGKEPSNAQAESEAARKEKRNEMIEDLDKALMQGERDIKEIESMYPRKENLGVDDLLKIAKAIDDLDKEIFKDRSAFIDDEDMGKRVNKIKAMKDHLLNQEKMLHGMGVAA